MLTLFIVMHYSLFCFTKCILVELVQNGFMKVFTNMKSNTGNSFSTIIKITFYKSHLCNNFNVFHKGVDKSNFLV
jgi:hypothetical protein